MTKRRARTKKATLSTPVRKRNKGISHKKILEFIGLSTIVLLSLSGLMTNFPVFALLLGG